ELERIGQRRAVEHGAGGQRHPLEDVADFAAMLVLAVLAAPIGDAGEAGQRRDGPVDQPQHLAIGDVLGRLEQFVTAHAAAAAGDDAGALQFEQDLLEEFLGDRLVARNLADHAGLAPPGPRQRHQGAQRVFRLLRDHASFISVSSAAPWARVSPPAPPLPPSRVRSRPWLSSPSRSPPLERRAAALHRSPAAPRPATASPRRRYRRRGPPALRPARGPPARPLPALPAA